MKEISVLLLLLLVANSNAFSQTYPTFGTEKKVTITGLSFDAMEPFIATDGNTLFFNSLNSGGNTNLYYATKLNDTTFTFMGLVGGCLDTSSNHLDAVASSDSLFNFYWTSLRSIPNLHRGVYANGNVNNISKVYGTCNILVPGWIIMDAAINFDGSLLYYSNAYFGPTYKECVGVPCEAKLAVAQKANDSTFNKTAFSDALFSNINDTNYLVYAPQITQDGLELYFTRLLKGSFDTEICVSVRKTIADTFGLPLVLYSEFGRFPEAASPTTNKQILYYHKKNESSVYAVYMRYRNQNANNTAKQPNKNNFIVYPNPTNALVYIRLPYAATNFTISVCNALGKELIKTTNQSWIDFSALPSGPYCLTLTNAQKIEKIVIIKE